MCGKYSLARQMSWERYKTLLEILGEPPHQPPRYNITPGQQGLAALRRDADMVVEPLVWGFRPSWMTRDWMREKKRYGPPINARAESLFAPRSMWAPAAKRRRCLVFADGFYEPEGPSGQKRRPQHYFRFPDERVFAFAGLWTSRDDEETGEIVDSFALITSRANAQMEPIHDRAPVILNEDRWTAWLDPALQDQGPIESFLEPWAGEAWATWEVSRAVTKRGAEGPECIAPVKDGLF